MLPKDSPEKANVITHAIGILLTLMGTAPMIAPARFQWETYHIAGLALFCLALLLVFLSSTLYHGATGVRKRKLKVVDHICIYILIGASHTPFVLRYLDNSYGYKYLFLLWTLILLGILYKLFLMGRWKRLSLAFYLFLGWMAVFIMPSLSAEMSAEVFRWIMIGGVSYSVGAVFYAWERLTYSHAIWHVFVIGGSFSHWVAMYYAYNA